MDKPDVFHPDPVWQQRMIAIVLDRARAKGIDPDEIASGEINCGSTAPTGAVVLKDGRRIEL